MKIHIPYTIAFPITIFILLSSCMINTGNSASLSKLTLPPIETEIKYASPPSNTITISPSQLTIPTITSTVTLSPSFAPIVTSTITQVPTIITPIFAGTTTKTFNSNCSVNSGYWDGGKSTNIEGITEVIVEFDMDNCELINWEIWFQNGLEQSPFLGNKSNIAIIDNYFTYKEIYSIGTLIFKGWFNTSTTCYGTLYIPKGYLASGWPRTAGITLEWAATYRH